MATHFHRKYGLLVLTLLTLSLTLSSSAHIFWLEPSDEGAHLFLGDASDDERYSEETVGEAGAKDSARKSTAVTKVYDHGHLHLVAANAQVLWVQAEYGFWVKTVHGWQEGTKSQVDGVRDSAWHVQFAKLVKNYKKPQVVGLPLEIVIDSVEGKRLVGKVLYQGQPAKNVPLFLGHKKVARTNSNGEFKAKRRGRRTVISAVLKQELQDHPEADHKILTSTLTLEKDL